jgi:hypothetical protein
MTTSSIDRKKIALLSMACVALAGRAHAATPTDVPPVYQVRDTIDGHPERLVGPYARLTIKHGVLTGRLERGAYNVRITPQSAKGAGPLGAVDVKIKRVGTSFDVAGVWNGGDLHFVLGPDGIHGTAMKQISDEDRGYQSCRYEIAKVPRRSGLSGLAECLGANPLRFEVQPTTSSELTDEENAILLVAYLAAPPAVWNP